MVAAALLQQRRGWRRIVVPRACIVALSTKIVDVIASGITVRANCGIGGKGGAYEPGGAGGAGGTGGYNIVGGAYDGCDGGPGGTGGNGGGGGGGHGGHSAPIAVTGNLTPTVDMASMLVKGTAGMGGQGVGNGATTGNSGALGHACSIVDLDPMADTCLAP